MIEIVRGKKGVSLSMTSIFAALCLVLMVGLVGSVVNYSSTISGKDSTIAAKNSQIATLDLEVSNLQDQVAELSNEPVVQPVQFSGALQVGSGTLANGVTYFYYVPNGTRLVIEYVSARVGNLDPSDSIDLEISTTVNGSQVTHYLGVASPQGREEIDPFSQAYQFVSQQVRIYADSGSHVSVGANRVTRINNTLVVFSLSGYLIEVP